MAADDARQRSLHAGDDDDGIMLTDLRQGFCETMQAGDANVGEAGRFDAKDATRDSGLVGNRKVAGAGTDDGDRANLLWRCVTRR